MSSRLTDISQRTRAAACDWLVENILNVDEFNKKNTSEKVKVFGKAFITLAEILVVMDLAEEGTDSDIVQLVLQQYKEVKDTVDVRSMYSRFETFCQWLQNGKKKNDTVETREFWASVLLEVIEKYFDSNLDKNLYFQQVHKAKATFQDFCLKSDPNRTLSLWGLGISLYLQARIIDPQSDVHTQTAFMLLVKAQEKMTAVISRKNNIDPRDKLFLTRCYYHLALVKALLTDIHGCLLSLTKAKVNGEFTTPEQIRDHPDFKVVSSNSDFLEILSEDLDSAKERLSFEEDMEKNNPSTSANHAVLERSMTESQMFRNALTTSTLDFLVDKKITTGHKFERFFSTCGKYSTLRGQRST